jgi:uncharacterized membrane protein YgcG
VPRTNYEVCHYEVISFPFSLPLSLFNIICNQYIITLYTLLAAKKAMIRMTEGIGKKVNRWVHYHMFYFLIIIYRRKPTQDLKLCLSTHAGQVLSEVPKGDRYPDHIRGSAWRWHLQPTKDQLSRNYGKGNPWPEKGPKRHRRREARGREGGGGQGGGGGGKGEV